MFNRVIKEQEAGMPTVEVCRMHGLSQGTFDNNVSPHSSLENKTPAEARRALEKFDGSALDALAQNETEEYEVQTRQLSL